MISCFILRGGINVFNLIVKDILIIKKYLFLGLIYVPVFIFAFQSLGNAMLSAGVVGITYIFITTACANDDKNKSDILLNSLPINRFSIVLAKYFSVLLYALVGIIEYIIVAWLISIIGISIEVTPIHLENIFGALIAVFLINGIYLPLFFKFGYLKSRIINMILFLAFFFGIGILLNQLNAIYEKVPSIRSFLEFILQQSDFMMAIALSIILIGIASVSMSISLKVYKDREF